MATNVTPPRGELDRFDSVEKKESITHNEYAASDPSALEGQDAKIDIDHGIDPTVLKRIIRKVDWRLVPTLAAMYCVSLIDRTNLSYARQANNMWMDTELGTKYGNRYSIITAVFFIPYIILEIPVCREEGVGAKRKDGVAARRRSRRREENLADSSPNSASAASALAFGSAALS